MPRYRITWETFDDAEQVEVNEYDSEEQAFEAAEEKAGYQIAVENIDGEADD